MIEREFSEPQKGKDQALAFGRGLFDILGYRPNGLPPGGPCLDDVLKGGDTAMADGTYSLEQLFGRGRKFLPRNLPCRRRGRQILYGYKAVLRCLETLLSDQRPRQMWIPNPASRAHILNSILERAKMIALPEVVAEIEAIVRRYA